MKKIIMAATAAILLHTAGNAQQAQDSTKSVLVRVENAGNCISKYHSERKAVRIAMPLGLALSAPSLHSGFAPSGDRSKVMQVIGVTTLGVTLAYCVYTSLRSERWLKRAGLELTGGGVAFKF